MKKIKNQKGSTIIVCLIIMFFLSSLAILNFNSSKNDLRISGNINARNIKGQAAENGINMSIRTMFTDENNVGRVLQIGAGENISYCSSDGAIMEDDCELYYMDQNETIKSHSITKLNENTECLAYGNSDKKPFCFIIEGYGEIPLINSAPSIHIQEVQINTININNNGIYEL